MGTRTSSICVFAVTLLVTFGLLGSVPALAAGSLVAWGWNESGQCDVAAGNNCAAVAAGYIHNLVLKSDGTLAAWGDNTYGECDVPAGNNYTAVAAGDYHSLALKSDGSLVAWGYNGSGQCNVPSGSDFVAVAAGGPHSVALKSDGSLVAWGENASDECAVPAGNDYVAVCAGYYHGIALKSDGSLVAWGRNLEGQGNVPAGNDYVAVSAGDWHSVALKSDGSLVAWGLNANGQCTVPEGKDYAAVAAGSYHNVALKSDGSLVAWGDNNYGACNVPAEKHFVAVTAGRGHSVAVADAPKNVSVTPSGGSLPTGAPFFIQSVYSETRGYAVIKRVYLLINDSFGQANAALVMYDRSINRLYLKNDANSSWGTGYAPGTAVTLSNSQCEVSVGSTTVSGSGDNLTVNWRITLNSPFSAKNLNAYMYVQDVGGLTDGWDKMGIYYNVKPQVVSIAPNSGPVPIDTQTTLTSLYRDPNGFADLRKCYVLVCESFSQSDAMFICYDRLANKVYLKNDTNTSWGTGYAPGSAITLSNSQCEVYLADTTVSGSGNDLTVTWSFKLKPGMDNKNLYSWMYATDSKLENSGYKRVGTHFTPVAPVCLSLSPNSGNVNTGLETPFMALYEDTNGWADIYKIYIQLSVTSSQANAVLLMYDAKQNKVFLRNDAGTSWGSGGVPGSAAILENSQCKVNMASFGPPPWSVTDTQLQVSWPIELKPSQIGKRLCERLFVQDNALLNSGWHVFGYVRAE